MTYQETIEYLYTRLPAFSRIGAAAYKKDLHNTLALLEALGNPHLRFRAIHIAGTNGKGSVSHMLAAILQHHGLRTGLYTSPHLRDFGERIRINGAMIDQDFVVDFVESTRALVDDIEPSFFEMTVAMAFAWFAHQQVDIAVIETGLGGRLDSTNVITPMVSVITNIGWDHMNLLGNSLEQIAFEKAGIIKSGVPVVVGEWLPETRPVFERVASERHSPLSFADEIYPIELVEASWDKLRVKYTQDNGECIDVTSDLNGLYQQYNIRTVLAACHVLEEWGFKLSRYQILDALRQVKSLTGLHGRWEVIHEQPYVVLDVGHNEAGISQVIDQLRMMITEANATTPPQVFVILGMVADKEIDKVLALLPAHFHYVFSNAHLPRALPAAELADRASGHGLQGPAFEHVHDAIRHCLAKCNPQDVIVVCGSVFLVGEVDAEQLSGNPSLLMGR